MSSEAGVVVRVGMLGAIVAAMVLLGLAVWTAAETFKSRSQNRFTDAPSPQWLRVFPRFVYRKVDWRQVGWLLALAVVIGFGTFAIVALAAIGFMDVVGI